MKPDPKQSQLVASALACAAACMDGNKKALQAAIRPHASSGRELVELTTMLANLLASQVEACATIHSSKKPAEALRDIAHTHAGGLPETWS